MRSLPIFIFDRWSRLDWKKLEGAKMFQAYVFWSESFGSILTINALAVSRQLVLYISSSLEFSFSKILIVRIVRTWRFFTEYTIMVTHD